MECKNCALTLQSEDNFCKKCGAKIIHNRLTLRNVFEDFGEQFFNWDNKFLQTLYTLFKAPEEVINSYIYGTRKKYVNVISYFALALTLSGFQIFVLRKFFPETMDISEVMPDTTPESFTNIDWVYDYMSIFALINLPVYAFIAKMVFTGLKKYNYTEHLVIMTYIIAQMSIVNFFIILLGAVLGGNFYVIGYALNLVLMLYTAYCYKRLYPLKLSGILLRILFFVGITMVLLIIIGIIQLIILYFSGGLEEMMEAQKAKIEVSYMASSVINWIS